MCAKGLRQPMLLFSDGPIRKTTNPTKFNMFSNISNKLIITTFCIVRSNHVQMKDCFVIVKDQSRFLGKKKKKKRGP